MAYGLALSFEVHSVSIVFKPLRYRDFNLEDSFAGDLLGCLPFGDDAVMRVAVLHPTIALLWLECVEEDCLILELILLGKECALNPDHFAIHLEVVKTKAFLNHRTNAKDYGLFAFGSGVKKLVGLKTTIPEDFFVGVVEAWFEWLLTDVEHRSVVKVSW